MFLLGLTPGFLYILKQANHTQIKTSISETVCKVLWEVSGLKMEYWFMYAYFLYSIRPVPLTTLIGSCHKSHWFHSWITLEQPLYVQCSKILRLSGWHTIALFETFQDCTLLTFDPCSYKILLIVKLSLLQNSECNEFLNSLL